jgi:hypothetical protein
MTTPNQPGNPSGEPPWGGQPQGYGPAQNPQNPNEAMRHALEEVGTGLRRGLGCIPIG